MLEKRGLASKVIEYGLRHQHGEFQRIFTLWTIETYFRAHRNSIYGKYYFLNIFWHGHCSILKLKQKLKMAWRCYVVIFVKIGKQHHSKSPILKICVRAARNWNRAKHFYIAYNTPHKIWFQMSGRSVLCDLWFSQTLRHKNGISIYMSIYIYIFTKNQKVWLCGRGDLTSLFFSKVVKY